MKRLSVILTIILVLLMSSWAFGANIVVEDIGEATPYYKIGTSSDCGSITTGDTAGDLEAAEGARGAGDTLYICAGTYTGTELDADSVFDASANAGTIQAVGTVNLDSDGANYVMTVRGGGTLTISGFNMSGAVLYQVLISSTTSAIDTVRLTGSTIDGAAGTHCIYLAESGANTITNIEIDNSTIKNAGNGAGANDGINVFKVTSGMNIHDDTIYNCGSEGVDYAGGLTGIIDRNYIYTTANGIKVHGQQYNVVGLKIRFNKILRDGANAGNGMTLYDLTQSTVTDNTIYVASGANHYAAMKFGEVEVAGSFYHNTIKNNTTYGNPDYNSGCWYVDSSIIDDFNIVNYFSNNIIYTANATIVYFDTGTNITTANWASAWLPYHSNDINSDPLLDTNYNPSARSPARNAGVINGEGAIVSDLFDANKGLFTEASLLGSELIVNGDCTIDSFTEQAPWVHDAGNGEYDCDGSQGVSVNLYQTVLGGTAGLYKFVYTVKNYGAAGTIKSRFYTGGTSAYGANQNTNDTFTDYLYNDANTRTGVLADTDFIGSVDDISTKRINISWVPQGSNTMMIDSDALKISCTGASANAAGAKLLIKDASDFSSDLTPSTTYVWRGIAKVEAAESVDILLCNKAASCDSVTITSTSYVPFELELTADDADECYMTFANMASGEDIWIDFLSFGAKSGIYTSAVTDLNGRTITDSSGKALQIFEGRLDIGAYEFGPVEPIFYRRLFRRRH